MHRRAEEPGHWLRGRKQLHLRSNLLLKQKKGHHPGSSPLIATGSFTFWMKAFPAPLHVYMLLNPNISAKQHSQAGAIIISII